MLRRASLTLTWKTDGLPTHSKISQCFSTVSCVAVHISTQHLNPRVNMSLSPSGIRLPSKRFLSLHHSVQTRVRTHTDPHSMGTKGSDSRNKGAGTYIINLHPMYRSRMCGGTPPLLHTSRRLLNKYKDKLTFTWPCRPVYIYEGYNPQLQWLSSSSPRSHLSLVCLVTSCTVVRTK